MPRELASTTVLASLRRRHAPRGPRPLPLGRPRPARAPPAPGSAELRCPALVVWGGGDPYIGAALGPRLRARRCPSASSLERRATPATGPGSTARSWSRSVCGPSLSAAGLPAPQSRSYNRRSCRGRSPPSAAGCRGAGPTSCCSSRSSSSPTRATRWSAGSPRARTRSPSPTPSGSSTLERSLGTLLRAGPAAGAARLQLADRLRQLDVRQLALHRSRPASSPGSTCSATSTSTSCATCSWSRCCSP